MAPAQAARRIEGDESIAALTAEVRQLRVAVEQLARSQMETQALGIQLSAQQARVLQATQSLDAARKELDAAIEHDRDAQAQLSGVQDRLNDVTDDQLRTVFEFEMRGTEAEARSAELELQQARARENELSLALAREQERWRELISRFEQLTQ